MQNVVHGAASALDRSLQRVHRAGDMLLEWIGHQHVIVPGISVIGTRPRNVVDPIVCAIADRAARRISPNRDVSSCRRARPGSLLSEESRSTGYRGCHRRDLAKKVASRVDFHSISPHLSVEQKPSIENHNSAATTCPWEIQSHSKRSRRHLYKNRWA